MITVNEVADGIVNSKPLTNATMSVSQTSVTLNLTSSDGKPRLYCIRLEVKDVADNLQQARRFVLYDETTEIKTDNSHAFVVTSASADTDHQWQTHHNDVCLSWKEYFYNPFYQANSLLGEINPDGEINGIYEQTTGELLVSGTSNVNGITSYAFSWSVDNGALATEVNVANFQNQSFCHSIPLKDGETYILNIKATDIVNNTFIDNRTIHIDRSPPHINNIGLEKNGIRRLFAHGSTDLAKMNISFEVLDPHSGILNVEWKFGTEQVHGILGTGFITATALDNGDHCLANSTECYCPDVGTCENFKYSISLNKLVNNNTNIGHHNRNYYFTLKATNKAKLINIEHLDIIVDDSPPEKGVVFEGAVGSPDIDYTSEDEININWHGFIDHESGIKEYRLQMANKCLNKEDLFHEGKIQQEQNYTVVPYTESSVRMLANFTGKMYTNIIAINNAMEPSDVVCSDGIIRDDSAPKIKNIRIQHGRWSETIYCKEGQAWLFSNDIKRIQLSTTPSCTNRCVNSSVVSDMFDVLPIEMSSHNDTYIDEFMCLQLPSYDELNAIYLPNDHVYLNWDSSELGSQIDDCFVGFGVLGTNKSVMSISDFKSTHSQTYFKVNHLGVGTGERFYAHIKTINKAKLEKVTVVGPILIDETPPNVRVKPHVKLDESTVVIGWENDTFFDLEQKEAINQLFFQIVHDGVAVSPLLEWRLHDSVHCPEFSGGCFKYPLKRLQKMDSDLGGNFTVTVHVYNNAGHFTKVATDTFKLPSLYPPGQATVLDIDPEIRNEDRYRKDTNVHFTPNTMCASWQGFKHHENILLEIGIGSHQSSADVIDFTTINNTRFACVNSTDIKPNGRYFFLVRASCSGGVTVSSSNGVVIYESDKVIDSVDVFDKVPISTTLRFDTDNTNSSTVRLCMNASLSVGAMYKLMMENVDHNISIQSPDVLFQHQSYNASSSEINGKFVALSEQPCFQVGFNNISITISNSKLGAVKSVIRSSHGIFTRWTIAETNVQNSLYFKVALLKIDMAFSNSTDTLVIPYEPTSERSWHVFKKNIEQSDDEFYIAVKPCTNERCIGPFKSIPFQIESKVIESDTGDAKIVSKENECSSVSLTWKQFEAKSGMNVYFWAISRDKNANNILNTWTAVAASNEKVYTVNECISLPIHGHATLFICVKGYSAAGNVVTNCQQAVTETQGDTTKATIYDIDINHGKWNEIKEMIHSSNVGTKYTLIHDSELDFGTSNSTVAGAMLYATEREVIWFLMSARRLPKFEQCEHDTECIHSTTNKKGYATFEKSPMQYNTLYYMCAYSNVTYVERELFTETQHEIRSCSNGFIIDDSPPSTGTVDVTNTNGYINGIDDIAVKWNGFSDNINAMSLGYKSRIKYYSTALGTRVGGEDLKNYTIVGLTKSTREKLTSVVDGTVFYVTVKATDQAGLEAEAASDTLVVDTSPPVPGIIFINGHHIGPKYIKKSTCSIRLEYFDDPHCGIEYYELGVGTSEGQSDITKSRHIEKHIVYTLPNDLMDGHVYYITAKATNRAGLSSRPISIRFSIDRSPPSGGHVIDGYWSDQRDINYQSSLSSIHVHWKGFEDPHSDIMNYRVGLGTKPYIDDIHQFIDVGVRSDHVWDGSFKQGRKYYTTVHACNGAGLCHSSSSNGVIIDKSSPTAGVVLVGTGEDHMKYLPNGGSIRIRWFGFDDPQSGIDHYETCIGSGPYQCDVQPFTTCLLQSHVVRIGLYLEPMKSYYVTVRAFNKAGHNVTSTSDEFKIDDTPPVLLHKPAFILDNTSLKKQGIQFERSIFRVKWGFEDNESHIASHIVSLKTHHEGHTPVDHVHVGDVSELTVNLDKDNWLNNGDNYYVSVTSCNVAGLCTSDTSDNLLIDSTPPHQGGFKPPMLWNNYNTSLGEVVSNITLTWYGFFDAESNIDKYHMTISRNYSGQELSNGIVSRNGSDQQTTITINEHLKPDDEIILNIWAQNTAGMNSSVARITVFALLTSGIGSVANMNGILEIQRHSCDVHFCNGDCTCAVVGKPCVQTSRNVTCTELSASEVVKSTLPIIQVYNGLPDKPKTISASSACIAGHWVVSGDEQLIHRYEWSMGLKDQRIGDGIFDLKNEIPWKDSGKLKQALYCLPRNSGLEHHTDYMVYVKAWYGADLYAIFESSPMHTDHSAPQNVKGRTVNDSDVSCYQDYDVIDWMDSVTACWKGVFAENQGAITHFLLALGTIINGSDIFPMTDVGLATNYTIQNLTMSHGTTYYFTVTAYNNVGLHTSVSSDGFVVDMDTPIHGVVFNTNRFMDVDFQSSTNTFQLSWHGFTDHHSGVRSYHIAVVEDTLANYTNVSFDNVNLKTSFVFNDLQLKHGHSYVGLVKAVDAAGHESSTVPSVPVTIDTTPPTLSDCSSQVILYDAEQGLNDVSMNLNFTKNAYYSIKGFINKSDTSVMPILTINRYKMIMPTVLNNNGSIYFQHYYWSPTTDLVNVTISFGNNFPSAANASMFLSVSECESSTNQTENMEIQQIGLSGLGVKCLLVDQESSISKVHVGVGTSPGGFQVRGLSHMPPSGVIDVDLVHGTQIYATVIATNSDGLKSVYKYGPLLVDKTPPIVSNLKTDVHMINGSIDEVDIDVTWEVDDSENEIKYCLCGLGTNEHVTDLVEYMKSTDGTSCRFSNLQLQHGDRVFVSVKCINAIELSSVPTYKLVVIVLQPPEVDKANLNVISTNQMGPGKYIGAGMFVQSDHAPLQIEWSEFMDPAGIDHYEYRLTSQNTTIIGWRECHTTAAALSDVGLVNGRVYTVEMRAVNVGDLTSDPIHADVVFHSDAPKLSGKPATFEVNGRDMRIDWSGVFHLTDDLDSKYDVIVGTRGGYSDVLELDSVDVTDYKLNLPEGTIITRHVTEVYLTITCTYSTGLSTVFKTSYKF